MVVEEKVVFRRILVAWDGSEPATHAFAVAADLASKYRSDLLVLSVAPRFDDVETSEERERATRWAEERFTERHNVLYRIAAEQNVSVHFEVLSAHHVADAIVDYAHAHAFDLIVMGRRGTSLARVQRFLLGSTTDKVVRYARCPVLIVSPAT
jgi:nucleotide-binding universal stress UspA family protein